MPKTRLRRERTARGGLFLAASEAGVERRPRRTWRVAADFDNLIRLEPAAKRPDGGFHLVDTTMMYAPQSGGVKRYLNAKRTWLQASRPDVRHTLVVPGARTRSEGRGLVTVAAARLPFGDGYRLPASLTKWATVIRLLQPDVIEAGDVFVPGHAALEAGQALGAPVVGFCHTDAAALAALHLGDWAEAPAFNFWAQTFQRFDHVIAPSRHMAQRLGDAGISRVTVNALGVDTQLFDPAHGDRARLLRRLELPQKTRLLVFAGRPAREKNVEAMITAVERLGDPYHLLLIGAGKDARYAPNLTCLDYERDPNALAATLASCDAFLHANEHEIFGLVLLEAMAAGLPVIGPQQGGVGELVDDEVGRLARSSDPAHLAEAIEALFATDREALTVGARRRAVERHSWDAVFERLSAIYGGLAAGRIAQPLALSA